MTNTDHGQDAVQDVAYEDGTCFGCGPANPDGLQLKSYLAEDGDGLVATFTPEAKYNAGYPNVLYGGTVASLIDCHSLWTVNVLAQRSVEKPLEELNPEDSNYVTGELTVQYQQPTPLDQPVHLQSWIDGDVKEKTTVRCELGPAAEVTATGEVIIFRRE